MKVLLIAATEHEMENNLPAGVDLLITGVGMAATMYTLQKKLQQQTYDIVIQAGIAGTFTSELPLGKTVLVKQDCFGDMGMEEKGIYTPVFSTPLADGNQFPYTNGWLINNTEALQNTSLELVSAITVNKVSDSELQKEQMIKAFDPQIESMEGAAFHYVCLQEKIPFIQIRSISNIVGERDKSKWEMALAIKKLNIVVQKFINKLA